MNNIIIQHFLNIRVKNIYVFPAFEIKFSRILKTADIDTYNLTSMSIWLSQLSSHMNFRTKEHEFPYI